MTEFEKISTAACGTMMMGGAIASVVMLSQSAAESAAVGAEIACGSPGFQLAHNFVANSGTAVVCGPAGSLGLPGGICLPTTTATKATLTAKTATGLKAVVSTKAALGVGGKAAASVALKSTVGVVAVAAPIVLIVVGAVACGFIVKKLLKK